jgi:hypothetical protein
MLFVLLSASLHAQAQAPAQSPAPTPAQTPAQPPAPSPEPYAPDEFPGWLDDAWRAEAVFIGSFPLSLFVTLEVYDSYRYFSNGFAPKYAPWPFGSGSAAPYSPTETAWLGVSAVSLSLVVAGIDFLLGRLNDGSAGH